MKKIELKKCESCDKYFEVNVNNKRSNNQRFCSGTCAKKATGLNNKGKTHTKDWKEFMSLKNSGESNPFFGKKHTTDSIGKMSISSQWTEDKYRYCNMSNKEKEIFDGIMISDGSLSKSRISARFTLGFKYLETIERIIEDLPSMIFSDPYRYESKIDLRTSKKYINYYTRSGFYRDLLFEYDRWYINSIKVIPIDIKITQLFCYWWYVCDGFILNNNVYFCTDSFNFKDLETLKNKLIDKGFRASIRKNKRIFLNKKSSLDFLNWISNINIQKEYLYKWYIKKK